MHRRVISAIDTIERRMSSRCLPLSRPFDIREVRSPDDRVAEHRTGNRSPINFDYNLVVTSRERDQLVGARIGRADEQANQEYGPSSRGIAFGP